MGIWIRQILVEEFFAVEGWQALFIADGQPGIGRSLKQVLAIYPMSTLGKEADITGRGGANIEYTEGFFCFQGSRDLRHGRGTPGESLLRLRFRRSRRGAAKKFHGCRVGRTDVRRSTLAPDL